MWLGQLLDSGPSGNAGGLDPAHLPCDQHTDKEQDGKTNPKRQCPGHVAAFAGRLIGVGGPAPHHVDKGKAKAGQNGDEGQSDNPGFHGTDYPMNAKGHGLCRMLILIAAAAGVLVTALLGQWQLGRAAQKQALTDARLAQAARAPIDGEELGQTADSALNRQALLYRAVHLKGRWLSRHTVYLENRQMQGRPGFHVVTPLELDATRGSAPVVVLVQRGWAPRAFNDRTALPEIDTPTGVVQVQGHLAPWPSRLYDFGAVEDGPIRQNLDFEAYRRQSALPLLELSVQQSGPASEGLLRDWPVLASGIEKHHGYAFQWFGLSALIALLYVWFQIVQPRRKRSIG